MSSMNKISSFVFKVGVFVSGFNYGSAMCGKHNLNNRKGFCENDNYKSVLFSSLKSNMEASVKEIEFAKNYKLFGVFSIGSERSYAPTKERVLSKCIVNLMKTFDKKGEISDGRINQFEEEFSNFLKKGYLNSGSSDEIRAMLNKVFKNVPHKRKIVSYTLSAIIDGMAYKGFSAKNNSKPNSYSHFFSGPESLDELSDFIEKELLKYPCHSNEGLMRYEFMNYDILSMRSTALIKITYAFLLACGETLERKEISNQIREFCRESYSRDKLLRSSAEIMKKMGLRDFRYAAKIRDIFEKTTKVLLI